MESNGGRPSFFSQFDNDVKAEAHQDGMKASLEGGKMAVSGARDRRFHKGMDAPE